MPNESEDFTPKNTDELEDGILKHIGWEQGTKELNGLPQEIDFTDAVRWGLLAAEMYSHDTERFIKEDIQITDSMWKQFMEEINNKTGMLETLAYEQNIIHHRTTCEQIIYNFLNIIPLIDVLRKLDPKRFAKDRLKRREILE